jgi:hypothetical protein
MGEITSKVYSVSSRTRESFHVLSHVDDILQQLSEWAESLPQSMQLLEGSPATEDSNKITIHMMCNQVGDRALHFRILNELCPRNARRLIYDLAPSLDHSSAPAPSRQNHHIVSPPS